MLNFVNIIEDNHKNLLDINGDGKRNNRIITDDVSNQFAKAIKLLLEWAQQEFQTRKFFLMMESRTRKTSKGKRISKNTISESFIGISDDVAWGNTYH